VEIGKGLERYQGHPIPSSDAPLQSTTLRAVKKKELTLETVIYHNPRCSKSRATLKLLEERGLNPTIIEYLVSPPDKETLEKILSLLSLQPGDLMRRGESIYKELGLDNPALNNDELVQAMIDNPILIERPIVVAGDKARIGRPPEQVLEIFQ
jgi:arsenate reductase